jgi:hypothetical protein
MTAGCVCLVFGRGFKSIMQVRPISPSRAFLSLVSKLHFDAHFVSFVSYFFNLFRPNFSTRQANSIISNLPATWIGGTWHKEHIKFDSQEFYVADFFLDSSRTFCFREWFPNTKTEDSWNGEPMTLRLSTFPIPNSETIISSWGLSP